MSSLPDCSHQLTLDEVLQESDAYAREIGLAAPPRCEYKKDTDSLDACRCGATGPERYNRGWYRLGCSTVILQELCPEGWR